MRNTVVGTGLLWLEGEDLSAVASTVSEESAEEEMKASRFIQQLARLRRVEMHPKQRKQTLG